MERHMMNVRSSVCRGQSYCLFPHPQAVFAFSEAFFYFSKVKYIAIFLNSYCTAVLAYLQDFHACVHIWGA